MSKILRCKYIAFFDSRKPNTIKFEANLIFFKIQGFMEFKYLIMNWYKSNLRDLPWRKNKNPYSIWLSEIILQQTQVVQGLPYYEKFIASFPKVKDLADADEDMVLKLWQGLGYYSRARNLHYAAKQIVEEFDGIFPKNYKDLLKLKGVGDYTASAIASIAYKELVPTIDGNVLRVISRVFDVDVPVDTMEGKNQIKDLMIELIDEKNPGDFNQAVMELGAKVCKPKNPDCKNCPLNEKCLSLEQQNYLERPVKSKKVKVSDFYIDYVLIKNKTGIVMQQRDDSSIWRNLFEFPNVASEKKFKDLKHLNPLLNKYSIDIEELSFQKEVLHKLSHRNLHIRFFRYETQNIKNLEFISFKEAVTKAVPKPIELFLREIIE